MSGLNSISGLNKVNVDYRPEVGQTGKQQPENVIVEAGAQPNLPQAGTARSVVQQLDVLLLNAARKPVAADAAQKVTADRDAIINAGGRTRRLCRKPESGEPEPRGKEDRCEG